MQIAIDKFTSIVLMVGGVLAIIFIILLISGNFEGLWGVVKSALGMLSKKNL